MAGQMAGLAGSYTDARMAAEPDKKAVQPPAYVPPPLWADGSLPATAPVPHTLGRVPYFKGPVPQFAQGMTASDAGIKTQPASSAASMGMLNMRPGDGTDAGARGENAVTRYQQDNGMQAPQVDMSDPDNAALQGYMAGVKPAGAGLGGSQPRRP